jgi:hypothetical protein
MESQAVPLARSHPVEVQACDVCIAEDSTNSRKVSGQPVSSTPTSKDKYNQSNEDFLLSESERNSMIATMGSDDATGTSA